MYQFSFYVPESHIESVKKAVFDLGAGRIENYDCCCWQVKGEGQFRALSGSQPYFGNEGELSFAIEYRVEMVCEKKLMQLVLQAFKKAHPYETPAFSIIELTDIANIYGEN